MRIHCGRIRFAVFVFVATMSFQVDLAAQEEKSRPNIIVILADDMGLDSVSAFNDRLGMKTPALDALAARGTSFVDAHSTSGVCSPTRYSVLTGRYNWRSRLKRGIVGVWERPLIEKDRLTLPGMLQQSGYDTACIGKWHLGWEWPRKLPQSGQKPGPIDFGAAIPGGPCDRGFDYYFGDDVPNWPPYAWRENDRIQGAVTETMKGGQMVGVSKGPAVADWDFRAVLKEYSDRYTKYILGRKDQTRPFFLYAALPSPHTPIAPHRSFVGKSGVSEYADFLIQTDWAVGQLVAALKETGQLDNTVLFFTCDNGTSPKANFEELDAAGIHLNQHWRGWKADVYEGGHRVPFIVHWPGKIAAGIQSRQTITLADIMATCAEIVEYDLPDNAAEDSVSLLSELVGEPADTPLHDFVVHHSVSGHFSIRKGKWKLLLCRGSGGWSPPREPQALKQELPPVQLFDMGADPGETTNVYSQHPEIVQELTDCLKTAIESGRTTPGVTQENHASAIWWTGLPWAKPQS